MSKPLISIIMGVHNGVHKLRKSIDSILSQTYSNWEFVICDDGSTDQSYEWLCELARCDSRFIIIKNKTNSGLPYTLNHCIEHCNGEYIARMDDDDISYSNRFEKQLEFLNKHPEISFVSSCADIFDGIKTTGKLIHPEFPTKLSLVWQSQFVHPATMFRAKDLCAIGCYRVCNDTLRGQDYDLFMRMYGAGFRGANLQIPVYRYLIDSQSIKRRTFKARKGEINIRIHGYKAMKVMWWAFPFLLKPIAAHIITITKY